MLWDNCSIPDTPSMLYVYICLHGPLKTIKNHLNVGMHIIMAYMECLGNTLPKTLPQQNPFGLRLEHLETHRKA